jgi:hypothetical protein
MYHIENEISMCFTVEPETETQGKNKRSLNIPKW